MSKLRWHSDTRRQRTVHVGPTVDRWIEREAVRWGVSYSEAMNRLLASYWQFHQEVTADGSKETSMTPQLVQATVKDLREHVAERMERLKTEVEKVKSNLDLLHSLQDRAVAKTLTDRQYDNSAKPRGMWYTGEDVSTSVIEQKAAFIETSARLKNIEHATNPTVIEIMVNPDGALWIDTLSHGLVDTGTRLSSTQIAMVIGTVAAYYDRIVTAEAPRLQAELPLGGERFQGLRPPICAPAFVIRKHLPRVFSMAELLQQGTVTEEQAEPSWQGYGTTEPPCTGATLSENGPACTLPRDAAHHSDTLRAIIEHHWLHAALKNRVTLRATESDSMRVLVQTAMRLRPDRLIIGEVRGAEALEMLKSWATGHGGSACTIHAGSPERALKRLMAAVQEAGVPGDPELIGEVVDLIVLMKRRGSSQWGVEEIVACDGWEQGRYRLTRLDSPRKEAGHVNGAIVEPEHSSVNP
jgi:type IV secretion system protein VirB11